MGFGQSSLFKNPWREIKWRDDNYLNYVKDYQPSNEAVSDLRIMVYGPIGAGKSSLINSILTAVCGRPGNISHTCTTDTGASYSTSYVTHRIKKNDKPKEYCRFVVNDTMGLESGERAGVLLEDLRLAMMGHVPEKYKFKHDNALKNTDERYNNNPSPTDKVHVLVCVISANTAIIHPALVAKIIHMGQFARDLGIPHVAFVTKIDSFSGEIENDVKNVYKSKMLKTKMTEFSHALGIPLINMFPVKNYSGGSFDPDEDMNALLLTALKHTIVFGDDFVDDLL